jgi:hypothetical protein
MLAKVCAPRVAGPTAGLAGQITLVALPPLSLLIAPTLLIAFVRSTQLATQALLAALIVLVGRDRVRAVATSVCRE